MWQRIYKNIKTAAARKKKRAEKKSTARSSEKNGKLGCRKVEEKEYKNSSSSDKKQLCTAARTKEKKAVEKVNTKIAAAEEESSSLTSIFGFIFNFRVLLFYYSNLRTTQFIPPKLPPPKRHVFVGHPSNRTWLPDGTVRHYFLISRFAFVCVFHGFHWSRKEALFSLPICIAHKVEPNETTFQRDSRNTLGVSQNPLVVESKQSLRTSMVRRKMEEKV